MFIVVFYESFASTFETKNVIAHDDAKLLRMQQKPRVVQAKDKKKEGLLL